jgi:outer membrane protein assembly factor BamB
MRRRPLVRLSAIVAGLTLTLQPSTDVNAAASYDWLQFNGDAQHSGNNTHETQLSSANVASLARSFQVTLPAIADGAPVVLGGVSTTSGVHDLLFLTTKAGHLLALDAHTGATVWSVQHGPGSCFVNNGSSPCFTTSSPAVDPGRGFVYTYGLDGSVHKHSVATGTEVTTGGWPELTTNKPYDEKASSALSIATVAGGANYLYVTHGGYPGDNGDYQGHVTTINLASGAQNVFNAACSGQPVHFVGSPSTPDCASVRSAIWARGGVAYSAALGKIFMGTGNGDFTPSLGYWGDSVMALTPDGLGSGGQPLDTYTPGDFQSLENGDLDLGSVAPAILPTPASSRVQDLAVQSGKDGQLRLLDLSNLSSQGGPGHTDGQIGSVISLPQGATSVFAAIATWVNPVDASTWVFVATSNGVSGLRLAIDASGNPSLATMWKLTTGGTSPIVANNVLYYARSGTVLALDPTSGTQLWTGSIGSIHWESPVVANGTLYITDESAHLTAFVGPTAAPATPLGMLCVGLALMLGVGLAVSRQGGPKKVAGSAANWDTAWLAELDRGAEAAKARGETAAEWTDVRAMILKRLGRP